MGGTTHLSVESTPSSTTHDKSPDVASQRDRSLENNAENRLEAMFPPTAVRRQAGSAEPVTVPEDGWTQDTG